MSIDPASLLGQVAAVDPALRGRVIALANQALDEAEFLMVHGSPQVKTAIMRQFLSVFSKHLEAKEQDEELQQMRREWAALQEKIMGREPGDGGTVVTAEEQDAEVDRPDIV